MENQVKKEVVSQQEQQPKKATTKKDASSKKPFKQRDVAVSNFEERVVKIKRISKTTKGGRMMRFSALVVIGDKKEQLGLELENQSKFQMQLKKQSKTLTIV